MKATERKPTLPLDKETEMKEITKEALIRASRDQAKKVYQEAMDQADKRYEETIRQAGKDYWEVQDQAEKVYQETIAPKQGAGPRPSMNRELDGRTWEEMP